MQRFGIVLKGFGIGTGPPCQKKRERFERCFVTNHGRFGFFPKPACSDSELGNPDRGINAAIRGSGSMIFCSAMFHPFGYIRLNTNDGLSPCRINTKSKHQLCVISAAKRPPPPPPPAAHRPPPAAVHQSVDRAGSSSRATLACAAGSVRGALA